MAISQQDFWKLLVQSKLVTDEQCRQCIAKFSKDAGQKDGSAKSAAEWLLRQKLLSKYQASVLLAGRPGPFVFGPYKIFERIEGGRLNKQFRAVHAETKHSVLLKLLSGPVTENAGPWQEMSRWLPATVHPNLTRCYEVVDQGKNKFLVMQDLRGESLADLLKRATRIAPDEACRLIRAAATGLAKLHAAGIIHGDIRPANLWVEQDNNLKVLVEPDVGTRTFNLATAAAESDGLARADYAAPEFTQVGRAPDSLSDIYALGCTFYELVAGTPPFTGGDVQQKLQRHATEAIQPLDQYDVPSQLVQRIAYMMAKNPAVRFQSAQIVADQLAQFAPTSSAVKGAGDGSGAAAFESWLQQKGPATAPAAAPVSTPKIAASPEPDSSADEVPVVVPRRASASAPSAKKAEAAKPVFDTSGLASEIAANEVVATEGGAGDPTYIRPSIAVKRRAKTQRQGNLFALIASLVLFVVVAGIGLFLWMNPSLWKPPQPVVQNEPETFPPEKPDANATTPPDKIEPAAATIEKPAPASNQPAVNVARSLPQGVEMSVVADDGQSLWSPPTAGPAIDLKYVPPGAQLLFIVRAADLVAGTEGQRVLKAMGPEFEAARASWEMAAGVKLEEVEQLIVALYPNSGEFPRTAFVVRLKSDIDPGQLTSKWGDPAAVEGHAGIFQKGPTAYYFPSDDPRAFVMGPFEPLLKDAEAAKWQAPLLRREIGELVRFSDADRHVTIIFSPSFLLGDGQALFAGDRARAVPALEWLLGRDMQAGMLSLHFGEQFFFELRMESDIQIDRTKLASQFRERLADVPDSTEMYVANLTPHPYWRLIANRYPGMVRFFHQQSRIGVEGNHAIVNAVLPGVAAHNLVFGGEMLLASAPGAAVAAAGAPASAAAPKTVDDVLKSKISISFAQESLEFAMQNVVNEVTSAYPNLGFELKIKIIGTDLEKDGITRNQQVRDFEQADKTVAEVLTAMVRKANPITTVKEPNELDQKLVWVVGPDPDNPATKIVLVTTRTGADQKKLTLPEVFRAK